MPSEFARTSVGLNEAGGLVYIPERLMASIEMKPVDSDGNLELIAGRLRATICACLAKSRSATLTEYLRANYQVYNLQMIGGDGHEPREIKVRHGQGDSGSARGEE